MNEITKTCTNCNINKSITEYFIDKTNIAYGRKSKCKQCEYKVKNKKLDPTDNIVLNETYEDKQKRLNKRKKKYDDIYKIFQDKDCELLTTQEEYENIYNLTYFKYKFKTACCKSINQVDLKNFVYKNVGIKCKECLKKTMCNNENNLIKFKNNEFNAPSTVYLEHTCYLYIKTLLDKDFIVNKTEHYAQADFILKPINNNKDEWLKVQLKTTEKHVNEQYIFKMSNKNYDNHLLCLFCFNDKRIWLMDGKIAKNYVNISVGTSDKTKYKQYEVSDNIVDKINEFYNSLTKYKENDCSIYNNIYRIREQEYFKKRENMKYLKLEYPEIEGTVYDLLINKYKVQDKACGKIKTENAYSIPLIRHIGRKKTNYKINDNDFYWIWLDNTNYFFIIPQQILIDNNYISTEENNKCKTYLYIVLNSNKWYNEYKYDITDPDLENKLSNIFI